MKKLKSKRVWLVVFLTSIISFLFFHVPVFANSSVPDGNATGNSFDPRSVHSSVKNDWVNNKTGFDIKRGGKYPSGIYTEENGSRFVYDVYSGNTNQSKKKGLRVVREGGEEFIAFNGWSAQIGYTHHTRNNQATYIGLLNKNNRSEKKIFKTKMTALHPQDNKDIYYVNTNGPEFCPTSGSRSTKQNLSYCNMKYHWTGFEAMIPLEDVFDDGSGEWELYIIKNVGGNLLYDELILPFDFDGMIWDNGEVELSSGQNNEELRMANIGAARRVNPGPRTDADRGKHFTHNRLYTTVQSHELNGVPVWYGVRSPHDGNRTRYAGSMYWHFEGDIAMLSWEEPPSIEQPGTNDGSANGEAFWELRRPDVNNKSDVYGYLDIEPTGSHVATRNVTSSLDIGSESKTGTNNAIHLTVDSDGLKDDVMEYTFSYEFTNHYTNVFECSNNNAAGDCLKWVVKGTEADWSKSKTYEISGTIEMDFEQKEKIEGTSLEDILEQRFLVGKKDMIDKGSVSRKSYYEQYSKKTNEMNSVNELKTQTTLRVPPDDLVYRVQVPSGNHANSDFNVLKNEQSNGYYYPVDVDDSLKEEYANDTGEGENDYAFPLQQSKMSRVSAGLYELEYVTDLFFMTENTGFIIGYPYADLVRNSVAYGSSVPTFTNMVNQAGNKMKQQYELRTGQEHKEDMLYTESQNQLEKLQRYAIPVSPESSLEPNETYTNEVFLENMGLNDLTFHYGIDFSFEHYMFGSGYDDAWFIEQSDPRVSLDGLTSDDVHNITIKYEDIPEIVELIKDRPANDKMHQVRTTDGTFADKLKNIIGDWD